MSLAPPLAPRTLIVGAGAMGLVTGYHLHLAGAEVTFLVRPKRVDALSRPQILYCYDDATLKRFDRYAVISDAGEARAQAYDFVILTLDAVASRSAEGKALLKNLGAAIRETSAVVISGGVGFELRRDIIEMLGLADDRVSSGALGNLAHQVAPVDLPVHPPTDPEILAQADIAYRHNSPFGFILENRVPAIADRFAALYDASGISKCLLIDPAALELMTLTMFPMLAGSELMGWPRAARLPDDAETWRLTIAAGREVASLRLGEDVEKAGLPLTDGDRIVQFMTAYEADALPLDLHAFHAFHHGGKVAVQDLRLLQDCVAAGERQNKPMSAVKELLARLEAHRKIPGAIPAGAAGGISLHPATKG